MWNRSYRNVKQRSNKGIATSRFNRFHHSTSSLISGNVYSQNRTSLLRVSRRWSVVINPIDAQQRPIGEVERTITINIYLDLLITQSVGPWEPGSGVGFRFLNYNYTHRIVTWWSSEESGHARLYSSRGLHGRMGSLLLYERMWVREL